MPIMRIMAPFVIDTICDLFFICVPFIACTETIARANQTAGVPPQFLAAQQLLVPEVRKGSPLTINLLSCMWMGGWMEVLLGPVMGS